MPKLHIKKKDLLRRCLFIVLTAIILLIPALTMSLWARKLGEGGTYGDQNGFIHVVVALNSGAAFSMGNSVAVTVFQCVFSTTLVVICVLFINKWEYLITITGVSFGGFFNFFDRVIPKLVGSEMVHNKVLDYLQFSNDLVGGAIFNVPDMCVTGGAVLFLIAFITYTIIGLVVNLEKVVDRNKPINLFIDTTQKYLHICLFQGLVINIRKSIPTHNNLTDISISYIDKLLKHAKVKPTDIDNIYITIGPGSFTGDRIGTIIAKTWSNIKTLNVYTIESNRLQVKDDGISILDARGNKFYTAVYQANKLILPIALHTEAEIKDMANKYKMQVYKDFESVDIFANMLFHLNDFKKTNTNEIKPLYIKPAI